MKYLFLPKFNIEDSFGAVLDPYFINYIKNVLRYKVGEKIEIATESKKYNTEILKIDKKGITFKIDNQIDNPIKEDKLVLIQSVIKIDRFEWLIEKAIEIGVDKIYTVYTDRGNVKIEKWDKKIIRWEKIIYKALTQSHQYKIPKIYPPKHIEKIDKKLIEGGLLLNPWEKNLTFNKKIINNQKGAVKAIIGPEGGFSDREIEWLIDSGGISIKLPFPILRAETAAIVTLSLIRMEQQ